MDGPRQLGLKLKEENHHLGEKKSQGQASCWADALGAWLGH